MLCGRCEKPLLCRDCGEVEYSRDVDIEDERDRRFYECICKKFRQDKCECEKEIRYINKDAMWYIKSTLEAIMMFIGAVCFLGFVIGMVFVFIAIPMVWGKPISYQPFPWLNYVMSWSICVGFVNLLIIVSCDSRWREDYEDHSMVFPIEEKRCESK